MLIKYVYLLFALIATVGSAQVIDSFDDGNFNENPKWFGDTLNYIINADSSLQINAPAVSGISTIYTGNESILNASFTFKVHLDFNPSSQNYLRIFLQLPTEDFEAGNAVFLQIGDSQDRISLYHRNNGDSDVLIQSSTGVTNNSSNTVECNITRSGSGLWEVSYNINEGGWINIGQNYEFSLLSTGYFGFDCHYTSTRSTKFQFDDITISGDPFMDITPPKVRDFEMLDSFRVSLKFDEPMDELTISAQSFNFSNSNIPLDIQYDPLDTSLAFYVDGLDWNQPVSVKFEEWKDRSGNVIADTSFSLRWQKILPGDILFSEVMFDPSPAVYLPEFEYLELYINTDYPLRTDGIRLIIDGKDCLFPIGQLNGGELYVLGDAYPYNGIVDSLHYVNISNLPSLGNSEGYLSLWSPRNVFVNGFSYKKDSHDPSKQNGGWSLELTNHDNYCYIGESWRSSENEKGGSPGAFSVNETSTVEKTIEYEVEVVDSQEIKLHSNFLFEGEEWVEDANFVINGEFRVKSVQRISEKILKLRTFHPLEPRTNLQLGIIFSLENCIGQIEHGILTEFQMPEAPTYKDVYVSELLFDPLEKENKYIEFIHDAEAPIDCYDLLLGQKTEGDEEWDFYAVSAFHHLWNPNTYLVVSSSIEEWEKIHDCADEALYIEMSSFPSLPKIGARCGLFRRNQIALDTFCYSEDWHADYLIDYKGVSLERVDLLAETCGEHAWGSASELDEFGTPGCINSYQKELAPVSRLSLSSDIISSQLGIYQTIITFQLLSEEESLTLLVYNLDGLLLDVLARNKYVLGVGNVAWSGEGYSTGSYILQGIIRRNNDVVFQEKWLINLSP